MTPSSPETVRPNHLTVPPHRCSCPTRAHLPPGEQATVGLRPQHLRPSDAGRLRVSFDVVEQLGDVKSPHGATVGGAEVVARATGRLPVAPATEAALAFDPGQAILLDQAGDRLR